MKAVSDDFQDIWARKYGRKEVVRLLYKRRYWNGSAFVYETDWTAIEQSALPPMRSINWRLDTDRLNEFKASNVVLRLENLDHRWLPQAGAGIFGIDDTATSGYEPYGMKFQVQFGYILDDGTKEYTALFTGLAEDYRFDGDDGMVEITVSGNERLLKDADAQNVSDAFTLENCSPATGDGSTTDFNTTSTGVGRIDVVQVNGVTKTQGTDYTISHLNEVGAAQISFTVAPTAGHTVKATGIKWKANQTLETLIGLLCDEAGVGSGVRSISSVVFPGNVSGSKTITSQAHWTAGTVKTSVDVDSTPNSVFGPWKLFDAFEDSACTSGRTSPNAPTWTIRAQSRGNLSCPGTYVEVYSSGQTASNWIGADAPLAQNTGSWKFSTKFDSISSTQAGDGGAVLFAGFQNIGVNSSGPLLKGYGLYFEGFAGRVYLARFDNVNYGAQVNLADLCATDTGVQHTWRVTRDGSGNMSVYRDEVLVGSATDNTYTTVAVFGAFAINVNSGSVVTTTMRLDNIYYTSQYSSVQGVFESAIQDIGAVPVTWGTLDRTETLNGGSLAYYTASSTDGVSWDAYVAIGADGSILSALKRYFKVKVLFSAATDQSNPQVDELVANFATATVLLAIANFTSKTVYAAIQRLAQLCDYEWGFDGDGDFFFRSKNVSGAAVLEINQQNAIAALSNYKLGHDGIYNLGRVRSGTDGEYEAYYGSTEASEAGPTSQDKYGVRLKDESLTDILLANDSTISLARARLIYEANYLPKKSYRISCRMIAHLDLADILSVTYLNRARDEEPTFGDPLQTWGDSAFGTPSNVLALNQRVKTVGINFLFPQRAGDGFKADLDVQEIL